MIDLFLTAFVMALLVAGFRKPFVWVLAYVYIDVLAPQKISWFLLQKIPISLVAFALALVGWLYADAKTGGRFTFRQFLLLVLLAYCGITTLSADFPVAALEKWAWVWKALLFAAFLPLTLRTRLRIEGLALTMVFSAGAIIIGGGIKTLLSGGGYGTLRLFVSENTGLYEGSTLSMVTVATIPLILWLARFGTVFAPGRRVTLFAGALIFACLMIPVGTETRTGLICLALLGVLMLRNTRRRLLYSALAGVAVLAALPLLPDSYTKRMGTIESHAADRSASTRLAVWAWTWDYAKRHPFGGGFEAYRQNRLTVETSEVAVEGNTTAIVTEESVDAARAYHSAYFEMLGEQGWPGLLVWLLLHGLGLSQMEWVRHKLKRSEAPADRSDLSLANALQQAHIVYLVGALFIGVAFQPYVYMLVAMQIALARGVRARIEARRPRWSLRRTPATLDAVPA
jgi:probable O-glycosylation ligase (exosortase A-associated)